MKRYKKHISNSLIYTLSTVFVKAIPFLLLPIFTKYLSKEDYGILGTIASLSAIIGIYIGLKPSLFIVVRGPQLSKREIAEYISNIIVLSSFLFLIVTIILLVFKPIFFVNLDYYILILISCMALLNIATEILDTIFQIEKKAINYAILQVLKMVITISISLFLIVYLSWGWEGRYLAGIIVSIFVLIYAYKYLRNDGYLVVSISKQKIKELVIYLFPLTFHVLGLALMASIDIIFLGSMLNLEVAGVYTVAYSIGAIIGIVHDALLKVWSPEFYKRIKNANIEIKVKLVKFTYVYILFSILLLTVFIFIVPYVFMLMVDDKFSSALHIVPIIAMGLTFESFRKLFIGYYYNKGRNWLVAMMTLFSGIINIILNYFFIPVYGIEGAAYATMISYFIIFLITLIKLNDIEKMPWFSIKLLQWS